jgi:hypothetical protein
MTSTRTRRRPLPSLQLALIQRISLDCTIQNASGRDPWQGMAEPPIIHAPDLAVDRDDSLVRVEIDTVCRFKNRIRLLNWAFTESRSSVVLVDQSAKHRPAAHFQPEDAGAARRGCGGR